MIVFEAVGDSAKVYENILFRVKLRRVE